MKNLDNNICTMTDSYKFGSHWNMVEGVVNASSYAESRAGAKFPFTMFVGFQILLKENLVGRVVEKWMIDEARVISEHHLGDEKNFNIVGWERILEEFGGYLPLEIKAVPEGTCLPNGNSFFDVKATAPGFQWLVNYVEGILQKYWYPSTVATQSKVMVDFVKKCCKKSAEYEDIYLYLIHDFGYRSTTCEDQARIGGMAHIINSMGTDTVEALRMAHAFYGATYEELAKSVPATEHRISCHFGDGEGEFTYIEEILPKYPHGPISFVSDTYGLENFVENVVCSERIMAQVKARTAASDNPTTKFVVRPDSPRFKGDTPEDQILWIIETLADSYGFSVNSKEFKVLDPSVAVIYGDGLSFDEIMTIYKFIMDHGWSAENCIVGQGGGLLQKVNRDTQRSAIKCSAEQIAATGEWVGIQKNPSDKSKASKKGLLKLVKHKHVDGSFEWDTINDSHPLFHDMPDEHKVVFRNGHMLKEYTWAEVKENASQPLPWTQL